jgi:hypothetical protein
LKRSLLKAFVFAVMPSKLLEWLRRVGWLLVLGDRHSSELEIMSASTQIEEAAGAVPTPAPHDSGL